MSGNKAFGMTGKTFVVGDKAVDGEISEINLAVQNLNATLAKLSMRFVLFVSPVNSETFIADTDEFNDSPDVADSDDEYDNMLLRSNQATAALKGQDLLYTVTTSNDEYDGTVLLDSMLYSNTPTIMDAGYLVSGCMTADESVSKLVKFSYFHAKMEIAAVDLLAGSNTDMADDDVEEDSDDRVDYLDVNDVEEPSPDLLPRKKRRMQ